MGRLTESEAKDCIQGKLDCMNKCDVFDCKGTDECDSCNYCYSQGTFGEQKEAYEMAIKALEKQLAKKALEINERNWDCPYDLAFICPSCESAVIGQPYRPKHCKHCGQKLDWN